MKRSLLIFLGVWALLSGSCSVEWEGDGNGETAIPANTLRLSVNVDGLENQMAKTRATMPAENGEDRVGTLYLLFFEPGANRGGLFVDYVEVKDVHLAKDKWDIDLVGTEIDVTDPYHILALANAHQATEGYLTGQKLSAWMLQWAGKTENEVMTEALAWTQGGFTIRPDVLLMSGRVEKAQNQFEITVPLTRNLIRFDVHRSEDVKLEYEIVSVEIRNAYASTSIWNAGNVDYADRVGRIPAYYKYTNPQAAQDITGHLYAFENQVAMPVRNDKLTTCLIVQLKPIGLGTPHYYRINIAPQESAQMLKRNNVYRVTINNVGGEGSASADAACDFADDNGLDYTINYWNIDGGGLIVQDGSSILSVPVKTIRLGRGESTTTYSIFTFTNSVNSVQPLAIRSQEYSSSEGITASLSGNTLTLVAGQIPSGSTRTGKIVLGYAGLRAEINVVQTDQTEDFLEVHLPDGGIPRFAPFGGIVSGNLRVEASDHWTAELFMDGFSFGQLSGIPSPPVLEIGTDTQKDGVSDPARDDLISESRFRVLTSSANNNAAPREAFIVVTLDKDPENYAQVIRIAQDAKSEIAIVPNLTTTFNAMGTDRASVPNNGPSTFTVRPGIVDNGGTDQFAGWTCTIEGTDAARFAIVTDTHNITDLTNDELNTVTVKAVGMNTSGASYNARLVVKLFSNPAITASVNLAQLAEGLEFSPNTVPAVAKTGGKSQAIAVQVDASLKWKASIQTVGTPPAGRAPLVLHEAKLLITTDNGVTTAPYDPVIGDGVGYPTSTKFLVEFPKIYYPNRQIPIKATVTVTVADMTRTMDITQTTLTPANMVGYGMTGSPEYGGLTNTYNRGWDGEGSSHGGNGLAQIPGYRRLGVGSMGTGSINASVNYLHVVPHMSNGSGYNWSVVNNYMASRDAWTVISSQDNYGIATVNNSNSPLKKAGYPNSVYDRNNNDGRIDQRHSGTKIFQFLFDYGHTRLVPGQVAHQNNTGFHIDGVNNDMVYNASNWPATGVVLITRGSSESSNTNTDYVMMFIDIKNKFLWMGESQMFWYNNYLTDDRDTFLDNLMYFIANASKYGTHFTDMLLEEQHGGIKPPWDVAYWGRDVSAEITK